MALKKENTKLKTELQSLKKIFKLAVEFKQANEVKNKIREKITGAAKFEIPGTYKKSATSCSGRECKNIKDAKQNKENIYEDKSSVQKTTERKLIRNYLNPEKIQKRSTKGLSNHQTSNQHNLSNCKIHTNSRPVTSRIKSKSQSFQGISSKTNPETNNIISERGLLDSLESYYESEEGNIIETGKCKNSYINHKLNKGNFSKEKKKFLSECDLTFFSKQLDDSNMERNYKDLNAIIRKKIKGSSLSHRSNSSFKADPLGIRQKNCSSCDYFLSQGLSSKLCKKHSIEN